MLHTRSRKIISKIMFNTIDVINFNSIRHIDFQIMTSRKISSCFPQLSNLLQQTHIIITYRKKMKFGFNAFSLTVVSHTFKIPTY